MSGFPRPAPPVGPAGGDLTGDYPNPTVFTAGGSPILRRVATTGLAGIAMVNGALTLLTWTAPNDGELHPVIIRGKIVVTVNQTGGGTTITWTGGSNAWIGESLAIGTYQGTGYNATGVELGPGETVTVEQTAAQTAGTATFYGELWAA